MKLKCPFHSRETSKESQKEYIEVLENLSFAILEKIKQKDFSAYIEEMRLHHDKDLKFISELIWNLVEDILYELELDPNSEKSIITNIWEINRSLKVHLKSLYTIAITDIITMISVSKNLWKDKEYWIKMLLMNMDWGTASYRQTISQVVDWVIVLWNTQILETEIERISKLNKWKKVCHFISSEKKTRWLNEAWDILEDKFFWTFEEYKQLVNPHRDSVWSFHFLQNKNQA